MAAAKQSDHDLLIRLDTKIEAIIASIADLKSGTTDQLNDHENRIKILEDDSKDFKRTWKLATALIGGLGALLGVLIGTIDHIIKIFAVVPK